MQTNSVVVLNSNEKCVGVIAKCKYYNIVV